MEGVYLQLAGTPLIAAPAAGACTLRGDEAAQTVDLLGQVGVQLLRGKVGQGRGTGPVAPTHSLLGASLPGCGAAAPGPPAGSAAGCAHALLPAW